MKMKSILLSLMLIMGLSAMSFLPTQDPTIPKEVQDAFSIKFPQVQDIKWEEEGEGEGEYEDNNTEVEAVFAADGTLLKKEMKEEKEKMKMENSK